jgi:putative spermidine/putrescine transport system ATP-binding protein
VYERPANTFVAGFIGENNRIQAVVVEPGAASRVRLPDGTTLRAAGFDLPAGTAALLSLRPERVVIGPAALGMENEVEGRLEEVVYLGDHRRLRLRLPGGQSLVAKLPRGGEAELPRIGEASRIGFPAGALRVFRAG